MATRKNRTGTREKLLDAACKTFADKGYSDTCVADICQAAGANIAAVNYYFRSKENLYVEAFRHTCWESLRKYPPDGGVAESASAEQRLEGRLRSTARRLSDPQVHEFEIVHKELANPTGLINEAVEEFRGPVIAGFESVLRELLGPSAAEQQVRLCMMSLMSQCFGPLLHERRRKQLSGKNRPLGPPPLDVDVDAYVAHVVRFSLAGIAEVRKQAEGIESHGL